MTPPADVTPLALLALFPLPEAFAVTPVGKRPAPIVVVLPVPV